MNTLSAEQQAVVNAVEKNNVLVDSVAGCGKTTTSLGICKKYNNKKILIVTYNSKLRLETRDRAAKHNIKNCEIHTYHSLCTRYYRPSPTDDGISKVCTEAIPAGVEVPKFDIIILDEQQDMDNICFTFIVKFIHENMSNPRIVVLGDMNQSIYGFKGADYRYLTEAPNLFGRFTNDPWVKLDIHESFRVTESIARFVNQQLINSNRIYSAKQGTSVKYVVYDAFRRGGIIRKLINQIKSKYKPEDVFILSFSIRAKDRRAPVKIVENMLVDEGIPCYVPINDDQELDENCMKNKVTFSSFHQAKGRERKLVILMGFDEGTFSYYTKIRESPESSIINAYYVACTRASEELYLMHHYNKDFFPTADEFIIKEICEYIEDKTVKPGKERATKPGVRGVTDVIRFMPTELVQDLMSHLKVKKTPLGDSVEHVKAYTIDASGDDIQYEAISDLYGTGITLYNEISHNKNLPVMLEKYENAEYAVTQDIEAIGFDNHRQVTEHNKKRIIVNSFTYNPNKEISTSSLLRLCNYISSDTSGYASRWKQINNYDWVDSDAIQKANDIINENIDSDTREYEVPVGLMLHPTLRLIGCFDILTEDTLYEIKFTSMTNDEHLLQLAIYGYLDDLNHDLVLLNVREGFMYSIEEFREPYNFMKKIVEFNNRSELKTDYTQFMKNASDITNNIINGIKFAFDEPEVEVNIIEKQSNSDLMEKLRRMQKK